VASAKDLAIARYDELTADKIAGRPPELSQIDLAKIDAYARKHDNPATVLSRIDSLCGTEPWPGYDKRGVQQIRIALADADDNRTAQLRPYERTHKNRTGVLSAAERELPEPGSVGRRPRPGPPPTPTAPAVRGPPRTRGNLWPSQAAVLGHQRGTARGVERGRGAAPRGRRDQAAGRLRDRRGLVLLAADRAVDGYENRLRSARGPRRRGVQQDILDACNVGAP
jgi:hypothetical protein